MAGGGVVVVLEAAEVVASGANECWQYAEEK